jgi:hypothetical protein
MFELHKIPFKLENKEFSLVVDRIEGRFSYIRECNSELCEKNILSKTTPKVMLSPVEPVNLPKKLTTCFLVEFEKTSIIEPKATKKIFIKFPMEFGVFIKSKKDYEVIDIFSTLKPKFTLYGEHRIGTICRYSKSKIYSKLPTVNPLYEGIMELNIINNTNNWVEVSKSVFNACGMELWHSDELVSMKANMKIIQEKLAETEFINAPLRKGMKKSMELYTPKTVSLFTPKFTMSGWL